MTEYMECEYTYNGLKYNVVESLEVHNRLNSDYNFFNSYMKTNVGCLEATACDEPSNCSISQTEGLDDRMASSSVNTSVDEESMVQRTWTVRSTKFLLELFKERKDKFRDPKTKKRTLWAGIMQEMHKMGYTDVNEDILDRKLRNLKKTYRSIKDNNKKMSTGRGRITWEYYDIFEEIFSDDRTINFGSTISSFSPVTDQPSTTVSRPRSISTNFSRSTPSPQLSVPAKVVPRPSSLSTNCTPLSTPSPQSSARSSPWYNPNSTDSLIESNIDVNNSNFNCTPQNEYLNDRPSSAEMSDSVSGHSAPLKIGEKKRDSKEIYNLRKKLVAVEEERVKAIEQLRRSVEENNSIQRERNELLKQFLAKM